MDKNGKLSKKDQQLWEKIQKDSRYMTFMDRLDRWTKLLGTVLVKVSFVDPKTGQLVKETESGKVQLDMLHGGVYDIKSGASPYYITELMIGFGTKFDGFGGTRAVGGGVARKIPSPSNLGPAGIEAKQRVDKPSQLQGINRIYWSPEGHTVMDEEGKSYETKNPYGIVPAVPFFNSDPAHYYFLPINEPLIYANHAVNMRITDLNHIAKFQSFGVPVVKGVERPNSLRHGRPQDDFNQLKGGTAQSRFGGLQSASGFGAGGQYRTFDAGMGMSRDGNADAAALGFVLGPDTAVAVGEKGDFKFAHPNADITGLVKSIHAIIDMVRINHGLRPKHESGLPSSGFALLMEKIGVIEENIRRGKLFKEREQQLFQIIKKLWNTHNSKGPRFSEDCELDIEYVQPEFPVDPKTKVEQIMLEKKLVNSGDKYAIKKLFPHMTENEINKMIKEARKDMMDNVKFEAEMDVEKAKILREAGITQSEENESTSISKGNSSTGQSNSITLGPEEPSEPEVKSDNKVKQAVDSSNQVRNNGDSRKPNDSKRRGKS